MYCIQSYAASVNTFELRQTLFSDDSQENQVNLDNADGSNKKNACESVPSKLAIKGRTQKSQKEDSDALPAISQTQYLKALMTTACSLVGSEHHLALVLAQFANWDTGRDVRPGHNRLAETLGIKPRSVRKLIKALKDREWIAPDRRVPVRGQDGKPTWTQSYRLRLPSGFVMSCKSDQDTTGPHEPIVVNTTGHGEPIVQKLKTKNDDTIGPHEPVVGGTIGPERPPTLSVLQPFRRMTERAIRQAKFQLFPQHQISQQSRNRERG